MTFRAAMDKAASSGIKTVASNWLQDAQNWVVWKDLGQSSMHDCLVNNDGNFDTNAWFDVIAFFVKNEICHRHFLYDAKEL